MSMLEANLVVLSVHSNHSTPQNFFPIWLGISLTWLVIILTNSVITVQTFGDATEELSILNYPLDENLSLTSKLLFVMSVTGSLVIFFQPLYSYVEQIPLLKRLTTQGEYSWIWFVLVRLVCIYTVVGISCGVTSIIQFM